MSRGKNKGVIMNDEIMVSVICNTYNHEKYIERAMKGFISQQTDFIFEVLVHDDASTDGTAKIIKKYEKKYPQIIKPIYQKENQYSIDINNIHRIQFPRVRGKYVAFCEGDDFWTDHQKLSKQVHALELHPELDLCVHSANKFQCNQKIGRIAPKSRNCIISVEEMIQGGGGYVATNSLMFRSRLLENIPPFLEINPIDYAYQIYASSRGGALYLNEDMSVYNYMNYGSWTERGSTDLKFAVQNLVKCKQMLNGFDSYTNHKYRKIISEILIRIDFEILWREGNMKKIISDKRIYNSLNQNQKIKTRLRLFFPKCYEWLRKKKYHL